MKNIFEIIPVIILSFLVIYGSYHYIDSYLTKTISHNIPELSQIDISTFHKLKIIYMENLYVLSK